MSKYLSHDELQHIEYANKILKEHEELAQRTLGNTEAFIKEYTQSLRSTIKDLMSAQVELTKVNLEFVRSVRETKVVTSNVQELINYNRALGDLCKTLESGIIDKVLRLRQTND